MGILGDITGSLTGGLIGTDASSDAAKASANASEAGIAEQRRQFDTILGLQSPSINAGNAAQSMLASILGLNLPPSSFTVGGTTPPPTGGLSTMRPGSINPSTASGSNAPPAGTVGGHTFTSPGSSPMSGADIQKLLESFPGYQFAVNEALKNAGAYASATGSKLGGNVLSALADRTAGGIAMPTFNSYLDRLSAMSVGGQSSSGLASNAAMNTGASIAQGMQNAGDARASGILGRNASIGGALKAFGTLFEKGG